MSTEGDSRLQWIYESKGTDQLRERYDVWAADYDNDLGDLGWSAPQAAAVACARFASPDVEVLDAGCGTGLVGMSLAAMSFSRIVGFDLSPGMLRRSAERGVYTELLEGSLLERLPFDDGRFGSVVSVGVFTYGHVDGSAFGELARVTAAGGQITITFRDDTVDQLGYRAEQQRLIDVGTWTLVEQTDPMALLHEDGEDILLRAWTWEVR